MKTKHKQLGLMNLVFIVDLRRSVCYLVKVAPGVRTNGVQCGETPQRRDLIPRVVHHLLGVRNTDPKKNTHDSHAALRIQRTTRAVQRHINYMIHERL